MHPIIQAFEKKQIDQLLSKVKHPLFRAGDTLKVVVSIEEGAKKWTQTCEGVCISRVNKGIASNFTVRKLDPSGAVEMRFPFFVDDIHIEVLKRGKVRRAKLYYLKHCSRKAGRIKEITRSKFSKNTASTTETVKA